MRLCYGQVTTALAQRDCRRRAGLAIIDLNQEVENAMSAERERDSSLPPTPPHVERDHESLTDLMDRMDREAFRRTLEQRQLRLRSYELRRDAS